MRRSLISFAALALVASLAVADAPSKPTSPLDFTVKDIDGKDVALSQYKGKVVLIVNVASKCGNTPQYAKLEKLYDDKKADGLVILGFPANDFNGQEPGTNEEIKAFCTSTYDVKFPMFSKISVKGPEKAPLYKFLTEKETAGDNAGEIDWNFAKFLVGRDGKLIAHFKSRVQPDSAEMMDAINKALAAK